MYLDNVLEPFVNRNRKMSTKQQSESSDYVDRLEFVAVKSLFLSLVCILLSTNISITKGERIYGDL